MNLPDKIDENIETLRFELFGEYEGLEFGDPTYAFEVGLALKKFKQELLALKEKWETEARIAGIEEFNEALFNALPAGGTLNTLDILKVIQYTQNIMTKRIDQLNKKES